MRRLLQLWVCLALMPFLTGCLFFRGTPTPLPWVSTGTPSTNPVPQAGVTATTLPSTSEPDTATPIPDTEPATSTPGTQELPTATSHPTESPAPPQQAITLDVPGPGQTVDNPLHLRGHALIMPFEGTLVVRVYDAHGQLASETPIIAEGEIGQSATFDASIVYGGIPGAGRIEVVEFSPRDGSVVADASHNVILSGYPGGGYVEFPAPLASVTLPVKLLARVGTPGQQVNVTVRWEDGTQVAHVFTLLAGLDGRGLIVASLDRVGPGPAHPPSQSGAIVIHTVEGSPLAWQPLRILHPQDPGTMGTNVYWVRGDEIVPQARRVPRTLGIGRASLEQLLWGPVPQNSEAFTSAIPSPADVLSYPGRGAGWGERVRVRDLIIVDRVAYADFSLELGAHSGGAVQVTQIRQQIEATLLQFSTVDKVEITINGQPALLEP